jgi:hypothetical protein
VKNKINKIFKSPKRQDKQDILIKQETRKKRGKTKATYQYSSNAAQAPTILEKQKN